MALGPSEVTEEYLIQLEVTHLEQLLDQAIIEWVKGGRYVSDDPHVPIVFANYKTDEDPSEEALFKLRQLYQAKGWTNLVIGYDWGSYRLELYL